MPLFFSCRLGHSGLFGRLPPLPQYYPKHNSSPTPSSITLDRNTIPENQPSGTVVGTLSAIDPDEDETHTFNLTDTAQYPDNAHFAIDGNQLKSAASFDFETKDSYTLNVQVSDSGGLISQKTIPVIITDDTADNIFSVEGIISYSGNRTGKVVVTIKAHGETQGPRGDLYVAIDGSDTSGNGTASKPFATIQKAIDSASNGEIILVASGTYNENIEIKGKSVELVSAEGEELTIIKGDTGKSVILINSDADNSVVNGFTITGGTGRPSASSYGYDYYGGGIHCRTSAIIKNCIIRDNGLRVPRQSSGTFGGAIYSTGATTDTLIIQNCILTNNFAWASGGTTLTEKSKSFWIVAQSSITTAQTFWLPRRTWTCQLWPVGGQKLHPLGKRW